MRFIFSLLIYLTNTVLQIAIGNPTITEDKSEWINSILEGIEEVPILGLPGHLVVFGEHAQAILTAEDEEEILIAAAEYGRGRVVVMSQDAYLVGITQHDQSNTPLAKLQSNIRRWALRSNDATIPRYVYLHGTGYLPRHLRSSKFALWHGGPQGSLTESEVLDFVRNGGALLHAMTPWGWLQSFPDKSIADMPYYNVLQEVGISYSAAQMIEIGSGVIRVSDNKAHGAHIMRSVMLDRRGHQQDQSRLLSEVGILRTLRHVPKDRLSDEVMNQIKDVFQICSDHVKRSPPSADNPADTEIERELLDLWHAGYEIQGLTGVKAPGCEIFPGDYPDNFDLPISVRTLSFRSQRQDFYSTGLYAPAGAVVSVEVDRGNENKDWILIIGAHMDKLDQNILRRWPNICVKTKLTESSFNVASPYGGLIYLQSPNGANSITLSLLNVVPAPQFKLSNGAAAVRMWATDRNKAGLWADLVGKYVMITLPSSSIRNIEDPSEALEIWDEVIEMYHDLRGTVAEEHRRQWIVTDEQPNHGYMHAGYPIVTHLDIANIHHKNFLLNATNLRQRGFWGLFHEIGHNMQRDAWTFEGTTEVTCNIFTLLAMQRICGQDPWNNDWLRPHIQSSRAYLESGRDLNVWTQNAGMALVIYAQLARDFGWDSYKRVFRRFEALSRWYKPTDDQTKVDLWFLVFSEETNYNLLPLAEFWGFSITRGRANRLRRKQAYLPDDEVTRLVPDLTSEVLARYPGIVRRVNG